jgi:5'-deoxynucleotidase
MPACSGNPVLQLPMTLPKLELADLARAGHVTRWHSVRTSRDQTLAEHLFMVTRIASHLARDMFGPGLDAAALLRIMEYASLHDAPELLMGDLPSPLKRHIEAISGADNPVREIERQIAPWLEDMREDIRRRNPEHLLVIKLADLIDAILFIDHEGIGPHARAVCSGLHQIFGAKLDEAKDQYPGYPWDKAASLLETLQQDTAAGQIAFERDWGGRPGLSKRREDVLCGATQPL